jgi:hypothetical protein
MALPAISNLARPLPSYREQAGVIARDLFSRFFIAPDLMPAGMGGGRRQAGAGEARRARLICDYIAGMTDRYAPPSIAGFLTKPRNCSSAPERKKADSCLGSVGCCSVRSSSVN